MLLGLLASTVVSTFAFAGFAWNAALFALIPYSVLSFLVARGTGQGDAFVNILRAMGFVATPSLLLLLAFVGLVGDALTTLYAFAGAMVLYGGAGLGGFFMTEVSVRMQEESSP